MPTAETRSLPLDLPNELVARLSAPETLDEATRQLLVDHEVLEPARGT